MEALVRFHFKINTSEINDTELCSLWNELKWVLTFENNRMQNAINNS